MTDGACLPAGAHMLLTACLAKAQAMLAVEHALATGVDEMKSWDPAKLAKILMECLEEEARKERERLG